MKIYGFDVFIDYDATTWYVSFNCPKCQTEVHLYAWQDKEERVCPGCHMRFTISWTPELTCEDSDE